MSASVFVMSDVVGSTALWETRGEAMRAALEAHDQLVRGAIERARGRVFKHTGDGMIAVFDDADDAVAGALGAVNALAEGEWGDTGALEIRVSVHAGTASERDGDFFGSPVNKVARINGVGHGGQVLVSDVARQLMVEPFGTDLGVHQLRDLSEPVKLWQLDDGVYPSLRTLKAARHNLPVMPTEFIGRQAEVDELRALVDHHRLVTISGVGGCGKTRLAIEVAAASADKFPGGVWFADLTAERDGDKVGDRVNAALGVVEPLGSQHSGPVDVLSEATGGLATLVIIDNCEHLIDDVAEFAEAVLAQASSVSVVATSREALSVDGERVWRIPNLHDAAVELFVDRATAAGVDGLTEHLDRIAEICVQLDDIPLAIELAAARVSSLSVDGLAERLDDRFSLLGGGRGRRRQRQQTLQTMMDWSYGLLTVDEQHVLNQLAVFSGTFPLSGVEAVVGTTEVSVLEMLDSLVAQSLVVPSVDSDRYRLLETVRLYALDQLIAGGEVTVARNKHLDWICAIAGFAAWRDQLSEPGSNWQYELDKLAEVDNIVAALEWADENNNPDVMLDLFRGTQTCWSASGTFGRVGVTWRDRIPRPPESEPAARAGWLSASGMIDYNLGESNSAIEQELEAAAIVDTLIDTDPDGDWFDSCVALDFRGAMSIFSGDIPAALHDAERLTNLSPQDPTGWARYFSAHVRAMALFPQWSEESMAATVAAAEAARSVSELADAIMTGLLGTQLYRVGRHEEALEAALTGLHSANLIESARIRQVSTATRPLVALGRYEEALDIIETDFGPMLDAQHHNLSVFQLLGLTILLHGLDQIEQRDRLARTAFQLGRWDFGFDFVTALDHIYVNEEALAALPEPDPTELTPDRVGALISDTITEIHDRIAHSSPGPLENTPSRAV
jgi:predicted ATPase